MEIIHISENSNGYEIVKLLANRVNRKNSLAVIEKDGQTFMTGGFLINNDSEIRAIFDNIPKEKHYEFAMKFVKPPFVKLYYEE